MKSISFGSESHERLEIVILRYERESTGDYHDDNWISVLIDIHVGAFNGSFSAAFLTTELVDFQAQLITLHESLKGKAEFETLEGQLTLTLVSDNLGHIHLSGEAIDQAGIGNQLKFDLHFDQTHLKSSIQMLKGAIAEFPVRA